jgi:hypothetical protein
MPNMASKGQAAGALVAMAAVAMSVTVACSSGAAQSHGQATVRVSASPNGEASKAGPQVLADASTALAAVPAVRLTGTQTEDGETQKLDLRVQADGLIGSIETKDGTFQLLAVGGRTYTKGTPSAGASSLPPKALAAQWAGHWTYIDPADNTNSVSMSSDEPRNLKEFAAGLTQLDKGVTVDRDVTTGTLGGQPVVVVSESNGTRLYVSATGEPLPLKIISKGSDGDNGVNAPGAGTFVYGEDPVKLQAPSGAVSMQQILGKLLPSTFASDYPSGFPTDFPSAFFSGMPIPSGFAASPPAGMPSALVSEIQAYARTHSGGDSGLPAPAPTP